MMTLNCFSLLIGHVQDFLSHKMMKNSLECYLACWMQTLSSLGQKLIQVRQGR